MNETEDEFVRYTRKQWEDLGFGAFNEQRCREIFRRTRPEHSLEQRTMLPTGNIGEQLPLF